MTFRYRLFRNAFLLFSLTVCLTSFSDGKRILVLNAYHEGFHWADRTIDGIKKVLSKESDIELFVDYMDTKRCSDPTYYTKLRELYAHKYRRIDFDVVIACDDHALDFLLANRDELFPRVPVVFCGINDFQPDRIAGHEGFTGIYENYDVEGTVDLMLELHPSTSEILMITDATLSGEYFLNRLKRAEPEFSGKITFNYLTNPDMEQLGAMLRSLPSTTLVLWAIYLRTPDGVSIRCEDSVRYVADNSSQPVYCIWDVVGQGVVGGKVTSPNYQGEVVAERALDLLRGKPIEEMPVVGSPMVYLFDYAALQRFDITEKVLPSDSLIMNQPYSVYQEYKQIILLVCGFVVVLLIVIIVLVVDIQKRRQAERALLDRDEQLRQTEKMSALGQLAGGIAHDFNNQLAGVVGYADLLLSELQDEELKGFASGIKKSALRSADLTAQLLAFSRRGKYLAVPMDVHVVLNEVVSILERSIDKRIRLSLLLRARNSIIVGDPSQLQNALFNIALNARDAMPDGGEIRLETGDIVLDEASCRTLRNAVSPGKYISVVISDTGCGMDEDTKPHIFEPFYTTKEVGKGTGMGLASVYGTVSNHLGAIVVKSELEEGTMITVYLPTSEDPLNETLANEPIQQPVRGTATILLVDDEEVIRNMAGDILRALGYRVAVCCDGREAVDYYRKHWQEIDLVLLDMVMPEMNGCEAFRAMRENNPDVRVILSSGYSINGEAQEILDNGVKAFIGKPYGRTELSSIVARILSED